MNYSLLNIMNAGRDIYNTDLFQDIVLPQKLEKEQLVNTILTDCYDLIPIENDFHLFKSMVDNWFLIRRSDFEKIYIALKEDYNPIHNFDRYEDLDENRTVDRTDGYRENRNSKDTGKVSAFNENVYQPRDENSVDEDIDSNRNVKDVDVYKTQNHLYGNIGVTTTQQMLNAEIDLRLKNNIYKIITIDFRREFMLQCL